jgi:hypothetical protein
MSAVTRDGVTVVTDKSKNHGNNQDIEPPTPAPGSTALRPDSRVTTVTITAKPVRPRVTSSRLIERRSKASPVEMRSRVGLAPWRRGNIGMADEIPDRIRTQEHGRQPGQRRVLGIRE